MKIEYCRFFKTHKVKIILLRNKETYLHLGYFLNVKCNILFFRAESNTPDACLIG